MERVVFTHGMACRERLTGIWRAGRMLVQREMIVDWQEVDCEPVPLRFRLNDEKQWNARRFMRFIKGL